jgi:hypothetical protein
MALFAGNVVYCVAALLFGWLTDAIKPLTVLLFLGFCWLATGTYMFGPAGWPFPAQLDVIFVGLVIGHLGAAAVMVPMFAYLAHCAGASTVRAIALLCSCHELGFIAGQIASTQLMHAYNFRIAISVWSAAATLFALWAAILTIASDSRSRGKSIAKARSCKCC